MSILLHTVKILKNVTHQCNLQDHSTDAVIKVYRDKPIIIKVVETIDIHHMLATYVTIRVHKSKFKSGRNHAQIST